MRTLLLLDVKLPEECGPTPVQPSVLFSFAWFQIVPEAVIWPLVSPSL